MSPIRHAYAHRVSKILRKIDVSSEYSYFAGIASLGISAVVAIITFYKLLLIHTNIVIAFIICLIVFYVFTEVYSAIILAVMTLFKKNEDKL